MELRIFQTAVADEGKLYALTYTLLERDKYIEDIGEILVYGIDAEMTLNGDAHSGCKICDISSHKEKVLDIMDKLCRGCVFPKDMIDIVIELSSC